eukprot:gene5712-9532_t
MYSLSTQKLQWTFTPKELKQEKEKVLKESIEKVNKIPRKDNKEINFLTLEEHEKLTQSYEKKILLFSQRLNFTLQSQASSVIFFKRFFFRHSVFEYDITNVMLGCLFLSTKIEEERTTLDEFLDKVEKIVGKKFSTEMMNKIELIILEGLNFELVLYHPHRSLTALIHDFCSIEKNINKNELFDEATKFIQDSYLTDSSLIFSPSIIAMTSIYTNLKDKKNDFINYLKSRTNENMDVLIQNMNYVQNLVSNIKIEETKKIEKKLKSIRKIVMAFVEQEELKYQQEQNKNQEEKRKLKLEKLKKEEEEMERELLQ